MMSRAGVELATLSPCPKPSTSARVTTLSEIEATLVTRTRPLFSFGATVLFVGIMLSVFQQFIGINAVLYYGPLMFKNAGFTTNVSLLQTIVA